MAKKEAKGAEDDVAPKKSKLSGVKKIVGPLVKALSLVSLLVLFGGVYTLGFMDLRPTLYPLGTYFIFVFAVCAPLSMLFGAKPTAGNVVENDDDKNFKEGLNKKVSNLETKINSFFATQYDVLKEENEKFKSELNALEEEKTQKVISELDELRQRNAELQEQLNNMIALSPAKTPGMISPIGNIPDDNAADGGVVSAPPNEVV